MIIDEDILIFLDRSSAMMHVNALGPDWENTFVEVILSATNETLKGAFKRGFAKSVLGQLSGADYETATGWDFDTTEEYQTHLNRYWERFYGSDAPEDFVSG